MPSQPLGPTLPTIGRIVHIAHPRFEAGVPAIVTQVLDDASIAATVFVPFENPTPIVAQHVEIGPGQTAPVGTWHWPAIR